MPKYFSAAALLVTLCVSPALAQAPKLVPVDSTVTLSYRATPVTDILAQVAKDGGITVQFAIDVKQEALQKEEINFQMSQAAFEDALTLLLKSVNLTYKVMNAKTIQVITPPSPQ